MKINYKFNYWACDLSVLAAIYCVLAGSLWLAAVNWGFVIYNWYIAGWLKEKQSKKDNNEDK